MGGLVKHLAFIEDFKFSTMLHGRAPPAPWNAVDWDADIDWPWHSAAQDSPEDLYGLWHDAVIRSRSAVAQALADGGLGRRIAYVHDSSEEPPSLRRLLVDVIEEYARHVGHADLIRETVDGLVGEDPPGQPYPYPALGGVKPALSSPMDATDNTGKAKTPKQATGTNDAVMAASSAATDRPFGPDGATILATEHWSLLGTRSMIWNEAMSRTAVFLTVLSASIVALALLADATGFGRRTTTVALVLLPVVFLLGLATYVRLVQINSEDVAITRAMNRLRYAYLVMAPDLRPYFTTGHHDDERGIATTHLLGMGSDLQTWPHFLVTTPTIVATVDAAVATAIVVLAGLAVEAPTGPVVAAGAVAFLVIWGALFSLQPGAPRSQRGQLTAGSLPVRGCR